MAVFAVGLVFILALAGYSDANYCVCNSGLSESVLQKSIDYACGNGADCTQIQQNGPCYNPNTVRDHCSYAVNSYYQKKGNAPGSCDFGGTATVTSSPPSVSSGCVYPSSPSNTGGTTPTTSPPTGGTPTTPPTGGTPTTPTPPASPNTGGGGGGGVTTPGTFPGGNTTPGGAVPGSPLTPGFGLAPTGSGGAFGNTDSGVKLLASSQSNAVMLVAMVLISSLFWPMI